MYKIGTLTHRDLMKHYDTLFRKLQRYRTQGCHTKEQMRALDDEYWQVRLWLMAVARLERGETGYYSRHDVLDA